MFLGVVFSPPPPDNEHMFLCEIQHGTELGRGHWEGLNTAIPHKNSENTASPRKK